MGSSQSKTMTRQMKAPEIFISDTKTLPNSTCDYIEVEDAKNAVLESMNASHSPKLTQRPSTSSPRMKTPSPQLIKVSTDYMEPWDSIPGKNIHNALNIVNSQPIKSQESKASEFLSECSWYYGEITRREAEKFLTSKPLYSFLVRKKADDEYTLSLKYQFGYIHMMIDQDEGKFTLGSLKTRQFLTLLDLINHYQRFPMDVEGVGKIQLKLPKVSG